MILTRKRAQEITYAIHEVLSEEQRTGGLGEHIGPRLDGACMAGSALAVLVLKNEHVRAGSIGGFFLPSRRARPRIHWWSETACGWIIDPTATQFRKRLNPIATQLRTRHDSVYGLHKLFYLGGDDLYSHPIVSPWHAWGMVVTIKKPGPFLGRRGFIVGEDRDRMLIEPDQQCLANSGLTALFLYRDEFEPDPKAARMMWIQRCTNDLSNHADAFLRMARRLGISPDRARAELGWNQPEIRELAA